MRFVRIKRIAGEVTAPASKSMVQRILAASLLTPSSVQIRTGPLCSDSRAAMGIIQALGAKVSGNGGEYRITGTGLRRWSNRVLDCRESGLCLRMFSALSALAGGPVTLKGKGSLRRRSLGMIIESLQAIRATGHPERGRLPLTVRGGPLPDRIRIPGEKGSQFLTGLLMGLPLLSGNRELRVDNLQSRPYIDLTLQVLEGFGIGIRHRGYQDFMIPEGREYRPPKGILAVEGDYSGAAFLLVAGAVGGWTRVRGLATGSRQGDRLVIDVLQAAGARAGWSRAGLEVFRNRLRSFSADLTHCPDLFPPLAALATFCRGRTLIRGVDRLKNKESNRARSLCRLFERMGIRIRVEGNHMVISGGNKRTCRVDSCDDHRIAMAATIGAIGIPGGIYLQGDRAVEKSYPGFFRDLQMLGG